MSDYIVTKPIQTRRFSLIAGQNLPDYLAHPETIKQLRQSYGEDAIQHNRVVSAKIPIETKGKPGRKAKQEVV